MTAPVLESTPETIARAAEILRAGGLVVIPTETVYGLAADAANAQAVARVFAAKGRPEFNPLIAHVADIAVADREAHVPPKARMLLSKFWPGPLTLVAQRRANGTVCDLARAGLESVALRAPAHPTARALLSQIPFPLAAPSANRSGHVSPTTAQHAAEEVGEYVDLILDGGPCAVGVESSIVSLDANGATLLRPGGLASAEIEAIMGPLSRTQAGDKVKAPGMLARHYAPRAKLRLNAKAAENGEAYLAFGAGDGALNLSPSGDLTEAAANLFAYLRALDAQGAAAIAVAPIPYDGLGEAINDRLARAAEGR